MSLTYQVTLRLSGTWKLVAKMMRRRSQKHPEDPGPPDFESGIVCSDLQLREKGPSFSEEELVELEFLRDQEIDAMLEQDLLPDKNRWNEQYREGFCFDYPEMALHISTGIAYPVKPLTHQINNISLPRSVFDQLRDILRKSHEVDCQTNTYEKWCKRGSSGSGCFEFEMAALHIVAKSVAHLKQFRSDPAYSKTQAKSLRPTDHAMFFDRRLIMETFYGFHGLVPDPDYSSDVLDPFNPNWSKKATDMTDEKKLLVQEVKEKSEVKDSMWGIDATSIVGHGLANNVLRKTIEEVCAKIPDQFRILHIESVIRSDLVSRFLKRQKNIRQGLEKLPLKILKGGLKRETRMKLGKRAMEQDTLIEHLITPDLTFHCTREDLIPSIVRQGFLMPEVEKDIRCGATYGE